jgi:EmrB/QacA subfamily drug resistance transporter
MDDSNGRASGTTGLVPQDRRGGGAHTATDDRYKWVALSNTTLGIFMATLDSSIVIISLPAIFRGIKLDPLVPANIGYLLWMLMGYLVVTAVLVVTLGRIGDIFGRVKMYNLGFAIFTVASAALSLTPWHGPAGAMWLIVGRVIQGIGGALLMANSTAILTDAFPVQERGMAMGINMIAAILGSFIGLIVGGLLADINWRAVFWINVPFGIFGTIWAYRRLRDMGERNPSRIDWWGNLTFGVGLVAVLIGMTYGLLPYGGHTMGWTSPMVLSFIIGGLVMLAIFGWVERQVDNPMFDLRLFRIRAFTAGNIAGLLSSIGRGGLMFMVVIWLQGIWLPLHGYSFERTPLWAGIYMLPTTAGFLVAGPVSGWLSDRYGARPFATGGMIVAAVTFALLTFLPANFSYAPFGLLLFLNGVGFGLFAAPNTTGIMNAVPARQRGAASGMRATFQNSGMLLSIALFFSLMIAGLASALPKTMSAGLIAQGVPASVANHIAHLPPVGSLFAAFLGYNPMKNLLGPVLNTLPPARASFVTGKTFFPQLISDPFMHGLRIVFSTAVAMSLIAAAASWLRGEKYVHTEEGAVAEIPAAAAAMVATGGATALDAAPAGTEAAIAAIKATNQVRSETSAPAPRARAGAAAGNDRRARARAATAGSEVSQVPQELEGKLSAARLAFSEAQPALATVQSALAAGRAPRPDDLATLDKAAATLADVARPLGIEPTRATLGELEARLAAWEGSRGVRGALRRLAGATGPAVAVGGLSGLSAEADRLAAEASWSPDQETRAVLLVRLVELADMASNGGDDERILALDAELRTALGPGASSVVLAAGRGRLVLPADPFVDAPGPGGAGQRETGDVYAHSTGPVRSAERGPRSRP